MTTYPSMESNGEDIKCLLQEINVASSNNILPERFPQKNVVTEIGLAPTNEPNTWIMPILLPRETNLALPNESGEERL